MRRQNRLLFLGLSALLSSSLARPDIRTNGEITGIVESEDLTVLSGATVTLSGAGLIQRSVTQTTNAQGRFRFLNLNPGNYLLSVAMPGFAPQEIAVTVSIGTTASIPVTLQLAGVAAEVTVRGEAPLIDKASTQLATNFTPKEISQLPNQRSYIDIIESAPTVTDRSAYGAGGNVDGYDVFGFGAATNSYSLNGVMVNNLEFGNTWVNPNYDTVAEIQIVGPGSSAEYGNYTGAAVNVVTKTGTNEYHGGASAWYTSDKLLADNSQGIADLQQDITKYDWEGAVHLGGPIIREKLLFFLSAAYYTSAAAPFQDPNQPPADPLYNDNERQSYQVRLDYLLNPQNTISGMYNRDPIDETDDGLQPGQPAEIGYSRLQNTNTTYLSWQAVWGSRTASELKYAGVNGHNYRNPNAPLGTPTVYDYRVGLVQYNSTGFLRQQSNARNEGIGTVTHYLDNFLKASHDLRAGFEYEAAQTKTVFKTSGNVFLYIFPYSGATNYLLAIENYNQFQRTRLTRPGAFIQDNIRVGPRFTANIGVRYDHPSYIDQNTDKTLVSFSNWSPRVGASYDITGDGKTVANAAWGRYYEKLPTYGPGYYTGTGNTPISYYRIFSDAAVDPSDWQSLYDLIVQPENLYYYFESSALPYVGDLRNPRSDVFSVSLQRQIGAGTAVGLSFVAKSEANFFSLIDTNTDQVLFEPFPYTSPLDNREVPVWTLTGDPVVQPNQDAFGNYDFLTQRQRLVTLEVRSNPIAQLRLNASVTWERTTGSHDNNECAVLSLCTNFRFNNPNYTQNPFEEGELSAVHEWQIKLYGYYLLPLGVEFGASFRLLSGAPWGATQDSYRIPGLIIPGGFATVRLEPKDERHQKWAGTLNLQVGKGFDIGPVTVKAQCTVLNVFNVAYQAFDYYNNNINATYTYERNPDGSPMSSFERPQGFNYGRPRETRVGLRITF
ncbi:MAG: TonB-dependent receptor [Thermoanaerobaculia bacterium]